MDRVFAAITEASSDPLSRKSAELAATDVDAALRVISRWPNVIRYPGMSHALRCSFTHTILMSFRPSYRSRSPHQRVRAVVCCLTFIWDGVCANVVAFLWMV